MMPGTPDQVLLAVMSDVVFQFCENGSVCAVLSARVPMTAAINVTSRSRNRRLRERLENERDTLHSLGPEQTASQNCTLDSWNISTSLSGFNEQRCDARPEQSRARSVDRKS